MLVAEEEMASEPRDIERIVHTVRAAARSGEIPVPRKSSMNEFARSPGCGGSQPAGRIPRSSSGFRRSRGATTADRRFSS